MARGNQPQQPAATTPAPATAATPQATQSTLHIPPIPVDVTVTVSPPAPVAAPAAPAQPPAPPAQPTVQLPVQPQPQPAAVLTPQPAQKKGVVATIFSAIPRGPWRAIAACAFVALIGLLAWRAIESWKPREFRVPHDHTKTYSVAVGAGYASYQEPLAPSVEGRATIDTLARTAVMMVVGAQAHSEKMDSVDQVQENTGESNRHTETMSAIDAGLGKVVFYNTTADQSGSDPVTISGSFGSICLKGGEFRELMLPPGKYRTQIRYASYPRFSGPYDFEVVGVAPCLKVAPDGTQFNCVALGWL